ncbi:hypothetical protein HGRIS_011906 [Hohenbuehelia grisea]|uniref:HMG box domain-containing protein n=1 Tax=Hohenbuehelia grisea TaxID=104357 RepID=A0ABR3JYA0_9AGAR
MPALRTRDTHQQRSLEVTTDAPIPPSLAIISPTPRAFTFPATHNLSDSPYSSPSSSPFDPDRLLSCSTPVSDLTRSLTPSTSITSASSSPSHKRRKSSCSSDAERRPKKGDEDYIKRPENAFILFRRKCCEDRQAAQDEAAAEGTAKKQRQADLSKAISQQWKSLSVEDKQYWEQLAKQRKKEHEQLYPNYVYRPQRSKDKEAKAKARKAAATKGKRGEYEHETDSETITFAVPTPAARHGRSASAPTPPPYQVYSVPNVYNMTPSCPTSPSLLPMISRRGSHPNYADDPSTSTFDFMPSGDTLMPPSFGQAGQFEASLQSSEFLRGMYNMSAQTRSVPAPLHPLSMHQSYQQQLVSPSSSIASGSSSPASPCTAPFTPTTANMLASAFAQLDTSPDAPQHPHHDAYGSDPSSTSFSQPPEFAGYAWEASSIWPTDSAMIYEHDFDLASIPPIELGLPKFDELGALPPPVDGSINDYSQEFRNPDFVDTVTPQTFEGLDGNTGYGFEEMMATGHGY